MTEGAPIESEAGTIQSYNHRLSINPKRTWHYRFLFCGASNSDVDFILSAKILINITCKLYVGIVHALGKDRKLYDHK